MKLKSNQLETYYACSLLYDLFDFNAKLDVLPIENDSASKASVYYGPILIDKMFVNNYLFIEIISLFYLSSVKQMQGS